MKPIIKTKYGTVVLIASHKGGFDIKQANVIHQNITGVIKEYISTQGSGDYLVDIDSFCEHHVRFAILRMDDGGDLVEYADHRRVVERLKELGIIRLRLGDMLSAIIKGSHIRLWNYLDRGGNTLGVNVSEVGARVPFNVISALVHAGIRREDFEETKSTAPTQSEEKKLMPAANPFPIGNIAFSSNSPGDWSPSEALTPSVLHVVSEEDPSQFDFKNADLSPPSRAQSRVTPEAERRKNKPTLKTGTAG